MKEKTNSIKHKDAIIISDNIKTPFKIIDKRCNFPYIAKHENESYILQETEELSCKFGNFCYATPNIVSIYIHKALVKFSQSLKAFELIKKGDKNSSPLKIVTKNTHCILNYYEEKISSIIFSYTAFEAFLNLSIPEDYEYIKKSNKNTEIFNHSQIERYISTREKFKKIIPEIYKINNISNQSFYSKIIEIENLRDKLIHFKKENQNELYLDLLNLKNCNHVNYVISFIDFMHEHSLKNHIQNNCILEWPQFSDLHIFTSDSPITKCEDYTYDK